MANCDRGASARGVAKLKTREEVKQGLVQRLAGAAQVCKERTAILEDKGFRELHKEGRRDGRLLVAGPWDRKRGRVKDGRSAAALACADRPRLR